MLPTLYFEDATQEALAIHLARGWPSGSLWSDEGRNCIGKPQHAIKSRSFRCFTQSPVGWKCFTAHRKTTDSFILKHRRLTLNLMMQPLLLQTMTNQHQNISRQSGFLPRCLLAYPKSAMGARYYQEPPLSKSYLDDYERRIVDCLNQSQHLSQKGCQSYPVDEY